MSNDDNGNIDHNDELQTHLNQKQQAIKFIANNVYGFLPKDANGRIIYPKEPKPIDVSMMCIGRDLINKIKCGVNE